MKRREKLIEDVSVFGFSKPIGTSMDPPTVFDRMEHDNRASRSTAAVLQLKEVETELRRLGVNLGDDA